MRFSSWVSRGWIFKAIATEGKKTIQMAWQMNWELNMVVITYNLREKDCTKSMELLTWKLPKVFFQKHAWHQFTEAFLS